MKIETPRLILRKPTLKDVPDLIENGNDYEIHYNSFFLMKYPFGKKEALQIISEEKNSKNMKRFVIELKEAPARHSGQSQESSPAGGKVIGLFDLYNINLKESKLKIGYWIGKNYRRKGFVSEAVQFMIPFILNNFDVDKIIATALVDNSSSINLLEKMKFKQEKILKNDRFMEGKYLDTVQYRLTRQEYIVNKQT